jgi:hydroxymethylbilane synthase
MPDPTPTILRLGTRGSLLARTQSGIVAKALEHAFPGLRVELVILKTSGDQITERPLHEVGGKGLFTRELELALLAGQIDFAVHSYKDMPTTMPLVEQSGLIVAAVPPREDPRDVLVAARPMPIMDLPNGAKVGTGSLRRQCQLLALRPDLHVEPIRGNIDTRLRKQREGQFDAVVMAMAGLRRANLLDPATMRPIEPEVLLPAPAQGALALQCRRDDVRTRKFLEALSDPIAVACTTAERALVADLKGDCLSPIAALAGVSGGKITLKAAVGGRGGKPPVLYAVGESDAGTPEAAAHEVYEILARQGVGALLHGHAGA